MSDIQSMNSEMIEILKNYIEIFPFFNEKLEEIKADEILNINLELLKASITDLNINISNFKSDIESKINNEGQTSSENTYVKEINANTLDNYTQMDKKNMLALFFMYLMKIDKDSILNKPMPSNSPTLNSVNSVNQSNVSSISNAIPTIDFKRKYEYDDPELD
jgi:DNA polymerase III delta prime subunit